MPGYVAHLAGNPLLAPRAVKGFPIKIEMQSSHGLVTMEYKDVSLNEPDASLFTHPENCRQMPTMPGGAPH